MPLSAIDWLEPECILPHVAERVEQARSCCEASPYGHEMIISGLTIMAISKTDVDARVRQMPQTGVAYPALLLAE
jgi:hypothetical protein